MFDRRPVPHAADDHAWFPSPFSLPQYTPSKTNFDGVDYPNAYTAKKWKVLPIATQERYLKMEGGEFFSTGNHPVEMLLPVLHLDAAGFEIDVTTISGDPVKFEMWAFPKEDDAVENIYNKYKGKLLKPLNLQQIWGSGFTAETPYLAIFIPGGHGVLNDLPFSATVGKILRWAHSNQRYHIALCHGPAAMLSADVNKPQGEGYIYEGYKIVAFPDNLDNGANIEIGFVPVKMPRLVGERLRQLGVEVMNSAITGETHHDRHLLTGDSPLASNNLGRLAASALLEEVATRS